LSGLGLTPGGVAELAKMVDAGTISASAGNTILTAMVETGKKPDVLAQELNLIQKSDASELERILDQVLAENAAAVAEITNGGKKAQKSRGFLMGQVMQKTKGQANPKIVSELLSKKLGS
jgi:aspartyl-tRNA(Asn)/glutamyl-tRNA(Gln) amidotransferase subunit B